jgi:DNA-binding NtrC family response regulator
METIMMISEDQEFLGRAKDLLQHGGYGDVQIELDPGQAMVRADRGAPYDAVLIDLDMQGLDWQGLMELILEANPDTECIVMSTLNEARLAVDCLKNGAVDYLTKPISDDQFLAAMTKVLNRLRSSKAYCVSDSGSADASAEGNAFESIITRSEKMRRILREARLHALSDVTVLITGESGTGKELLARSIHRLSGRAEAPFTSINMASLAGSLFDAEFFGHTRGAFTGAERDRVGYLEHSNEGTVFLDEVADLPIDFQGKLLRVLEQGEYIRLGASVAQNVDVRFISATNADLGRLLARRAFRQDLYYRLKGAQLHLPPLRERREDIPLLVDHFISEFGRNRAVRRIDGEAMRALAEYDYPGNVRELRAIIQSAVNLVEGSCLTLSSLPGYLRQQHRKRQAGKTVPGGKISPLTEIERWHVLHAYEQSGKNKIQAARLLDIGVNTLRRKLSLYGIR